MNPNDPAPENSGPPEPIASAITAAPIAVEAPKKKPRPRTADRVAMGLWNWILPAMFLVLLSMVVAYAAPVLIDHWKLVHAHTEAETFYVKRRAELKAEAEHADERLELLDKRVHLVSLGFREVVRKVAPVVVNVTNYREAKPAELKGLEKKKGLTYDPDDDKKYVQAGVGSGVIIKPGVILTNYHVIKGADRLRITFASGQTVGIDPDAAVSDAITDLAVVKVPDRLLPAL